MSLFLMAASLLTSDKLPQVKADNATMQKVLTIAFVVIGAIALMLMVIAGFRYIISAGDANKIAETKRMIIYTAVGLILAASAAAIVNIVLDKTP